MSSAFSVGDHVWIRPVKHEEFSLPFGGKVVSVDKGRVYIQRDDGTCETVGSEFILHVMDESSVAGVQDMITLGELREHSILRNLKIRYSDKLIYTYTGTMLVAVNPYEYVSIYTNELIDEYRGSKMGELPPHIFAIGNNCYQDMRTTNQSQCVVISGESGAGKTESTKLVLQYLASISGQHSWIEQQILEANPILEAFGNARTVRNDNSSRFGKYVDIYFNKEGSIEGALIRQYLLEKSRIVSQSDNERNYHIFYYLLAGLSKDERQKYDLGKPSDYNYLSGGGVRPAFDERAEALEFGNVRSAMTVLSFGDVECVHIFKLVAAILHLGNIQFQTVNFSNSEGCSVVDAILVSKVAAFFGTTKNVLVECLTNKTIAAQGDSVVAHLTKEQACQARDAFAKAVYDHLFVTIVEKINSTIRTGQRSASNGSIGILDIFGFENFDANSFEQLCINYANENLQQFFVKHIFKLEQEYYKLEEIDWKHIDYVDNQSILDMIGQKSSNILTLMDDESKFPNGTDRSLLTKLHQTHADKGSYNKPRSDHVAQFGIKHFAGNVNYNVVGFLDKNRDTFGQDLQELIRKSTNSYLKSIFEVDLAQDMNARKTLSSQFRTSLDALMKSLSLCSPHFVRCIKPNELKKPGIFDDNLCCRQLRYSGMMETARIRQAGYPCRYSYQDFSRRFRVLSPRKTTTTVYDLARSICLNVFVYGEDYQLGKTKLFLKEEQRVQLETLRNRTVEKSVLLIQKTVKGWLYRRRYLKLKRAALTVQKHFRARGYRWRFVTMRTGYQRLQALLRMRLLQKNYKATRKVFSQLLPYCRGYLIRNRHRFGQVYEIVRQKNKEATSKDYKRLAESKMKNRLAQLDPLAAPQDDTDDESEDERDPVELVNDEFNFLAGISTVRIKKKSDDKSRTDENQLESLIYEEDLSAYNFRKFAATYFLKNINPQFSKKALKESLLDLQTPDDVVAAQTLWITLLRFMGDMAEPKFDEVKIRSDNVMRRLTQTVSKGFVNRKEFQDILKLEKDYKNVASFERQKMLHMTLKRKSKLLKDVYSGLVEDSSITESYTEWVNRRTNNIEKIHFIIGHGILRPELRDEIFCQICKQLTNNPVKSSYARGWILLSLCAGCFVPSDRFINYLRAFIRDGLPAFAPYCEARLNRTLANGTRTQPPGRLELQASKTKSPIVLEVSFADRQRRSFGADSSTTAQELCRHIAANLHLRDTFGFSLFISTHDKVMSLGSEADHVMDAISQCEQYIREQTLNEGALAWSLFFRKEIFAPWHDPSTDPVATTLIYHQIVTGFKHGEYRCEAEGDVATLIAQQYYIDNGGKMDSRVLHTRIGEYLPTDIVKRHGSDTQAWENKIQEAFGRSLCVRQKQTAQRAKEDVVRYAKTVWPILFSRFFEAIQTDGPKLSKKNVVAAVNCTGVYIIDDKEQILLQLAYLEISAVRYQLVGRSLTHKFYLKTIRNEEYIFDCLDAINLKNLIAHLLDGLKKRSRYCVTLRDYKHPDSATSFLTLKKGDLITLNEADTGETLMSSTWGYGECQGNAGDFPTEIVEILACTHKPHAKQLAPFKTDHFTSSSQEDGEPTAAVAASSASPLAQYTLESYAEEHFRAPNNAECGKPAPTFATIRKNYDDELWKYGNRPILQPLLKLLLSDAAASRDACKSYSAILRYAGEMPTSKSQSTTEIIEEIFVPSLANDPLKDEIYCQIIKQLTYNRLSHSEERCWELLYLATGLFVPSSPLLAEVNKYLKLRSHPLAEICAKRLQTTLKAGSRKHPPAVVEIEAVQHRALEIYHKVYFPDDTDEAVEIDSTTKAKDVCANLVQRLGLDSGQGFSLFVMLADRVFSIPDNSFFYDFLQQLFDWMQQTNPNWKNATAFVQTQYQVFFMRKLWINVVPGRDVNADHIFHYHQEVPKYLRGFHKSTKEQTVKLAALIYLVKYEDNYAILNQLSANGLKELVPQHMIKAQSLSDWKRQILSACKFSSPKTAKADFLQTVAAWPTFGSTFFEVKQSTDPQYPEFIIVAINIHGVNLMHPITKDILVTYSFAQLSNWSSGNTFFHLTIGNIMRPIKLLCETSQGYKMDDLITSYTNFLRNKEKRV